MAHVNVLTEILIDCPRSQVAAYCANPANAPAWYVNIKAAEWKTEPTLSTGAEVAFVAHFLGRRMAYTYRIEDWIPNERLVMRTSEGPFPMETTYTWEAISADQTRMTLRNRGNPTGLFAVFAPLMSIAMHRANRKDLARLKQLLEADKPGG